MNDFEALKGILERDEAGPDLEASREAIESTIRMRSQGGIEAFRRKLFMELLLGFLCAYLIAGLLILLPFRMFGLYVLVPLAYLTVYMVFLAVEYWQFRIMPDYSRSVMEALAETLKLMQEIHSTYIRLNIGLMAIFFPVAFVVGINFRLGRAVYCPSRFMESGLVLKIVAPLAFTAIMMLVTYPIVRWYAGRMFGRHIDRLRVDLDELQQMNGLSDRP